VNMTSGGLKLCPSKFPNLQRMSIGNCDLPEMLITEVGLMQFTFYFPNDETYIVQKISLVRPKRAVDMENGLPTRLITSWRN